MIYFLHLIDKEMKILKPLIKVLTALLLQYLVFLLMYCISEQEVKQLPFKDDGFVVSYCIMGIIITIMYYKK